MGKHVGLSMKEDYLNKSYCLSKAAELIDTKDMLKMDIKECAKEIYAHAVAYYKAKKLEALNAKCEWLLKRANPIDLQDGGDKPWRKAVYDIIWLLPIDD